MTVLLRATPDISSMIGLSPAILMLHSLGPTARHTSSRKVSTGDSPTKLKMKAILNVSALALMESQMILTLVGKKSKKFNFIFN